MDRVNTAVAACFLSLGAYLVISGGEFPSGVGGLPGAGFFPRIIGSLIILLALGVLFESRGRGGTTEFEITNVRQIAGAVALLFVYLALWGTGFFVLRTVVFLALLLKFLGQRWPASAGVAVALTAVVAAAFQYGLNVSLE